MEQISYWQYVLSQHTDASENKPHSCLFVIVGYGVVTTREFSKGDFILEYKGDLLDANEAVRRERQYKSQHLGCFMYYFTLWTGTVVSSDSFDVVLPRVIEFKEKCHNMFCTLQCRKLQSTVVVTSQNHSMPMLCQI